MIGESYIEWCNENAQRAYPVEDGLAGDLPDSVIVDMGIVLPAAYDPARIAYVRISPELVSVGVCGGTLGTTIMFLTERRSTIEFGRAVQLMALVPGASGWCAFGNLPDGPVEYRLSSGEGQLAAKCVTIADPPGVSSVRAASGDPADQLIGSVRLMGDDNIVVTRESASLIRLSLNPDTAASFLGPCAAAYADGSISGPPMIASINKIKPDANGRLTIEFV